MTFPLLFSIVIAQLLGAFALISGVVSLALALFGKHTTHRLLSAFLALIRIAAGAVLFIYTQSGIAVITLILAIFLIVEGFAVILASFGMRRHSAWVWMLINGVISLILGGMIYAQWPSDSLWLLGLFYGINAIFSGLSLLTLGFAVPKSATS